MLINRRLVLCGAPALLGLSACLDSGPAALSVSAQGAAGMNPGPDGADRPVTVTVMQLKSAGAFDSADFFALQNPSAALGGDLLRSDQIVVAPGGAASKVLTIEAGATVIGVIAGFRTPAGKQFRSKTAAPGSNSGLIISVGPSGLSLQAA